MSLRQWWYNWNNSLHTKLITKDERKEAIKAFSFSEPRALPTHLDVDGDEPVGISDGIQAYLNRRVLAVYRNDAYPNMLFLSHHHLNAYITYLYTIRDNSIVYQEAGNGTGTDGHGRRTTQHPIEPAIKVNFDHNRMVVNRQEYPSKSEMFNQFSQLTLMPAGWRQCLSAGRDYYNQALSALTDSERTLLFKYHKEKESISPRFVTPNHTDDYAAILSMGSGAVNGITVYLMARGVQQEEQYVFLDVQDALDYAKHKGVSVYGVCKAKLYCYDLAVEHEREYVQLQELKQKLYKDVLINIKPLQGAET